MRLPPRSLLRPGPPPDDLLMVVERNDARGCSLRPTEEVASMRLSDAWQNASGVAGV
jgi:hypothetical protein